MMEQFELVTVLTEGQKLELLALFKKEWWTRDRTLEDVLHVGAHSFTLAFIYKPTNTLVAHLRVISDYKYVAFIMDVIVAEAFRGQKLAKKLLESLVAHPKLAKVKKIELRCLPELEPFYEKCGFTRASNECLHMFMKP